MPLRRSEHRARRARLRGPPPPAPTWQAASRAPRPRFTGAALVADGSSGERVFGEAPRSGRPRPQPTAPVAAASPRSPARAAKRSASGVERGDVPIGLEPIPRAARSARVARPSTTTAPSTKMRSGFATPAGASSGSLDRARGGSAALSATPAIIIFVPPRARGFKRTVPRGPARRSEPSSASRPRRSVDGRSHFIDRRRAAHRRATPRVELGADLDPRTASCVRRASS